MSPPGDGRSRPGEEAAPEDPMAADQLQRTAPRRQWRRGSGIVGPYDPWRAAFRRGAIDALRLAARRLDDPHAWMVLSELHEYYDREDYLAGGGR